MTDELTEKVARAMSMHELRRDDAWPGYSELAFIAIAAVREAEADEIDRLRAFLAPGVLASFLTPIIEEQSAGEWTPAIIEEDARMIAQRISSAALQETTK